MHSISRRQLFSQIEGLAIGPEIPSQLSDITFHQSMEQQQCEQPVKKRCKRRAFTPEEDIKITQLVKIHGTGKWDIVASCLEGRNAKQCRERWRAFLSPGMVNGPWKQEEDQLLVKLYQQYGPKWAQFTRFFKGRSDYNIKNRWRRYYSFMLEHGSSVNQNEPIEPDPLKDEWPLDSKGEMGIDFHWYPDGSIFPSTVWCE